MKHIYFTVTNDLLYDQRMHRICNSLSSAGYRVTLVGRKLPASLSLQGQRFSQKRLRCWFNRSFLFYVEYNIRLFFYLLKQKPDAVCAIDLDTILPCIFITKWKKIPRVYDAHEYFTELKEVRTRPFVKKVWTLVERYALPKFNHCYTVSEGLVNAFRKQYNSHFVLIRNLPVLAPTTYKPQAEKFIVYQGAVNEARGFEFLIPAMKKIPFKLVICGDGNFMPQVRQLISQNGLSDKIELKGMMLPEDLKHVASLASLGIGLAEKEGINQFYALPNKFLEYMHAGLPQIAMNFPEYRRITDQYNVAGLLDDLNIDTISTAVNTTLSDTVLLEEMHQNALKAREVYCWQKEEKVLLQFYKNVFGE